MSKLTRTRCGEQRNAGYGINLFLVLVEIVYYTTLFVVWRQACRCGAADSGSSHRASDHPDDE